MLVVKDVAVRLLERDDSERRQGKKGARSESEREMEEHTNFSTLPTKGAAWAH